MEFKPIPNYETYGISQEGRVIRLRDGRVMAVSGGRVELWKNNERKRFSIRTLLDIVWHIHTNYRNGIKPTADIRRAVVKIDRMIRKNKRVFAEFEKLFFKGWEEGIRLTATYEEYNKHEWTDMYENDRFQLTRDGLVWNKKLMRFKIPYIGNNGYKLIRPHISLHRALKLTFDFIPEHKTHHVHHKDGDKFNNSLDNLQWLEAKQHSKLTSLELNGIPVVSECLSTGEIKVHLSVADCERHINGTKNNCIKLTGKNAVYYKGYLIKRYQ